MVKTTSSVSEIVQVSTVRFSGNGAIFAGQVLDDAFEHTARSLLIRCPGSAMGGDAAADVHPGDVWRVIGKMESYQSREQVVASSAYMVRPAGKNIIQLLSGPRFPGVGAKKAQELWLRFGEGLYAILSEEDVDSLTCLVTPQTAEVLIKGWREINPGDVVSWLDRHRFPTWLGRKLLDFYGATALDKMERDPYRLLAFGLSWKRVDEIATRRLSVDADDPRREHGAVAEALQQAYRADHTARAPEALLEPLQCLLGGASSRPSVR